MPSATAFGACASCHLRHLWINPSRPICAICEHLRPVDVKALLNEAYDRLANPAFIERDPVQVPRAFPKRADAEVIGFLTATIAWGQRTTIIANAWKLARLMDDAPHDFILNASATDLKRCDRFVHRTFNGGDLKTFTLGLRHLYHEHGGLEDAFLRNGGFTDAGAAIALFKQRFFEVKHQARTQKHVADPAKGSNAKRINMFLRWMVRPNDRGIDMGHWKRIPASALHVPLDVHTGRVARELGLLTRKQDDWKSVIELTEQLRKLDPSDPVKYDIALFGLGVEGATG
ncbi:MAG: TIGR02757 family protein [Flavobacteriales bacterium]|nr:MAG: TIGR02757 family protein [Flavobacteriales bacterium]